MTISHKSSLSKARGLGAAGTGTQIWFTKRITWAATIILSFLTMILLLGQIDNSFTEIKSALAGFWPTLLLVSFVLVAFYHYVLELTEVIEDYVHNRLLELTLLLLVRFCFGIVGLASILIVLRNFFSF